MEEPDSEPIVEEFQEEIKQKEYGVERENEYNVKGSQTNRYKGKI